MPLQEKAPVLQEKIAVPAKKTCFRRQNLTVLQTEIFALQSIAL
jgi:hypothetical protein